MKPEQMLELSGTIARKFERLAEIKAKASEEGRDLSRRERAEIEAIKTEAKELRAQLDLDDGRRFQANGHRSTPRDEREPELLKPSDSFAERVRERRGGFTAGGLGERGVDDGSLGRVLGALVTGDRSHLNEAEQRAMAEGAGSGQYLIGPELSSMVVDAARASSVAFAAGAMTLDMQQPIVYLPRPDEGVVAEWHAENAALAGSDQSWSRVTLSAKRVVAGPLKASRELIEDTDGTEAGRVIAADLGKQLGLALDLAVVEGSGGDEPLGIDGTAGVNTIAMAGAGGSTPSSFDELVKAVYAIQSANGAMATAVVMHPRDAETYALLKDGMEQPLRRPQAIAELPFLTTSQLDVTRMTGGNNDTSHVYVGDFSTVVVGFRPSVNVRFQRLEERYSDTLSVGLLTWLRCDIAVLRPAHLAKITGVRPTA